MQHVVLFVKLWSAMRHGWGMLKIVKFWNKFILLFAILFGVMICWQLLNMLWLDVDVEHFSVLRHGDYGLLVEGVSSRMIMEIMSHEYALIDIDSINNAARAEIEAARAIPPLRWWWYSLIGEDYDIKYSIHQGAGLLLAILLGIKLLYLKSGRVTERLPR